MPAGGQVKFDDADPARHQTVQRFLQAVLSTNLWEQDLAIERLRSPQVLQQLIPLDTAVRTSIQPVAASSSATMPSTASSSTAALPVDEDRDSVLLKQFSAFGSEDTYLQFWEPLFLGNLRAQLVNELSSQRAPIAEAITAAVRYSAALAASASAPAQGDGQQQLDGDVDSGGDDDDDDDDRVKRDQKQQSHCLLYTSDAADE